MARCSRCKQESWPLHKRGGFLNCESCLAELAGGFRIGSLWSPLVDIFKRVGTWVQQVWEGVRGVKRVAILETRRAQRVSDKFATMRPVKVVRIGGGYQKVK